MSELNGSLYNMSYSYYRQQFMEPVTGTFELIEPLIIFEKIRNISVFTDKSIS